MRPFEITVDLNILSNYNTSLTMVNPIALYLTVILVAASLDVSSGRSLASSTFDDRMDADRGEFPFAVQVRSNIGNNLDFLICTGAILNESWVLTTALCGVWSPINLPMIVRVGAHRIDNDGIDFYSQRVIASNDTEENPSGVALIHLQKAITFSPNVQPISVSRELVSPDQLATMVGWGQHLSRSKYNIQYFSVLTRDKEICNNILEVNFCVMNKFYSSGVVYVGFSAPAVINGTLIGLSQGLAERTTFWPMIRLTDYATWIEETIVKHSS